ncbi:hypothetical protein [Sinorhizobium sp. RAC02]|uniref:hypothetical protein n=1 Tax=Sinorhizobium sp. RAC02 TaxID=1842534 RepID=UPI0008558AEB|nr:hypothetical protein [Sinorhizobium sp. RAC02]AOF92258.1 hypothetical protein BSY16_6109 [Sinorhizobium sp. RAC02]
MTDLGWFAVSLLLSDHQQKSDDAYLRRANERFSSLCRDPSCPWDAVSLKHPRRPSERQAEQILHRFDLNPPDVDSCLLRLHAVFSRYRPQWGWCPQCFTPEEEAQTRNAGDPRRAALESFGRIYFDHDYFPMDGAMRLGLWRWPKEEQDALRALFCRVALNWFAGGDPVPFERVMRKTGRDMDTYVSNVSSKRS